MKRKLAVFVSVSDNIAFAAGIIGILLERYMIDCEYKLIVCHAKLSKKNISAFSKIKNCKLVEYTQDSIFFDQMLDRLPENCRFGDRDRLMRFSIFESFLFLDQYENVICMDADMLLRGSLKEMLSGGEFVATIDGKFKVGDQFLAPILEYDMEREAFCSAIIKMNDKIPYKEIYEWCYKASIKYAPYMKNGDQAILNLMVQEFQIALELISVDKWQCKPNNVRAMTANVVHFGTDRKVWNDDLLCSASPDWYKAYCFWLELGGDEKNDFIAKPQNIYNLLNDTREFLFPFEVIERNSNIVIYGYGNMGKQFVRQIRKSNWCSIKMIIDRAYQEMKDEEEEIFPLAALDSTIEFDYIVISIIKTNVIEKVERQILEMGIEKDKIVSEKNRI